MLEVIVSNVVKTKTKQNLIRKTKLEKTSYISLFTITMVRDSRQHVVVGDILEMFPSWSNAVPFLNKRNT